MSRSIVIGLVLIIGLGIGSHRTSSNFLVV